MMFSGGIVNVISKEMTGTQRLVLFVILVFVTGVISVYFYGEFKSSNFTTPYKQKMLRKEFDGVVINVNVDEEVKYEFDNGGYYLDNLATKWDEMIQIGDTIVKEKESLILLIKKKDGTRFKLNYDEFLEELEMIGYYDKSVLDDSKDN